MAGIGDALLGFASGAAGVINKDADANREFMRKHKAKIAESQLIRQEKAHDAKRAQFNDVNEYGTDKYGQYMHMFKKLGDHDQAVAAVNDSTFAAKIKKNLEGVKDPGTFVPYAVGMSDEAYRSQFGQDTIGSKLLQKLGVTRDRRQTFRDDEMAGKSADSAKIIGKAQATFGPETPVEQTGIDFFGKKKDEESTDELIRMMEERVELEADLEKDPDDTDAKRRLGEVNNRIDKISAGGRTDADLEVKMRNKRQIQEASQRLVSIDSALRSLDRVAAVSSPEQKLAAGGLQTFGTLVQDTVRGLTDLTNLTESSTDADRIAMIRAAGVTDADLTELEGGPLKGATAVAKMNAIYAVAGGMKAFERRQVNNMDIELATKLLKKLGGDEGPGVIMGLQRALKDRREALYKDMYLMEGLSPEESLRFGIGYLTARGVESNGYKELANGDIIIETPTGKGMTLKDFLIRGGNI